MPVDIIVPVHNGQRFVKDLVRTVQAQTFADWELLVVDDGSTDGTADAVRQAASSDSRIRLLQQEQAGVSSARNAGFAASRADLVSFLDVDDLWEPHTLGVLVDALSNAPDCSAVYGIGRYVDVEGLPVAEGQLEAYQRERHAVHMGRLVAWPLERPTTFEVQVLQNHVCTVGTVLFRREAVARAGLFDPTLAYLEDWDLLLRVCLVAPMKLVDRLVLGKRCHDHNVSNDFTALMRGLRRVREKMLRDLVDRPELQLAALLGQAFMHRLNMRREMRWAQEKAEERRFGSVVHHLVRALLFLAREMRDTARTLGHPGRPHARSPRSSNGSRTERAQESGDAARMRGADAAEQDPDRMAVSGRH